MTFTTSNGPGFSPLSMNIEHTPRRKQELVVRKQVHLLAGPRVPPPVGLSCSVLVGYYETCILFGKKKATFLNLYNPKLSTVPNSG